MVYVSLGRTIIRQYPLLKYKLIISDIMKSSCKLYALIFGAVLFSLRLFISNSPLMAEVFPDEDDFITFARGFGEIIFQGSKVAGVPAEWR